ncbi:MAG: hypothetical protein ABIZ80_11305 [Bryobacteraceae bacterium]
MSHRWIAAIMRDDFSAATKRLIAIPAPWLNHILYSLYVPPACAGWWHPPAGVSLLAVLRRK